MKQHSTVVMKMEINIGAIIVDEELVLGSLQLDATKVYPELEDLVVTPTAEEQVFESKKYGYDKVTVKGADLREDLSAELTAQDELITNQEVAIEDIINALEGRGAGIVPEGTLDITENGEYDVTNYEKANVSVTNVLNQYLRGKKTAITLEDMANIGAIRKYQFYYSLIKSIEIPSRTTQIGEYAFAQSQLASINMPNSVMTINKGIFHTCSKLTSVILSKNISSIPDYAFYQCRALTEIEIPEKVTSIGNYAFWDCRSITEITIPDSVTSIGERAFENCSLLASAVIGSGLTNTGYRTFGKCVKLESATISNGIVTIGNQTFSGCYIINNINIPESVTTIDKQAFEHCNKLSSIIIPSAVTTIGAQAFWNNFALMEVVCLAETPPTIGTNTFGGVPTNCVIKVPASSVEAYKSATNWSVRADYIVAYEEG